MSIYMCKKCEVWHDDDYEPMVEEDICEEGLPLEPDLPRPPITSSF